ncbi:MAG TPA: 4Fe-4S ferredoxin [Erysipelotrichaceae bacterium]|nr:4Fe-4S ferredoxin [Erysipelotrichaceae bacterium]
MNKEFKARIISSSNRPIRYDESLCIGCHRCAAACQADVLIPMEKGKPPVVMYPGECWYCGACVMECPVEGAIRLEHPLMNRTKFIEKKMKGHNE